MSTTYIAALAAILVTILPHFGIVVGNEELTQWLTGGFVFVSGIWIMYQRTKLQTAPGGVGDVDGIGIRRK